MIKEYTALSVVQPSGNHIVTGAKTLEIRKWKPEQLPLKNVLIVENNTYLLNDGEEEQGLAVAVVDIDAVHPWQKDEISAACASYWEEGYWAWELSNVRPLILNIQVMAKRKLYALHLGLEIEDCKPHKLTKLGEVFRRMLN